MSNILKCPQCRADVENQFGFGMITCPKCNTVFMFEPVSGIMPIPETPSSISSAPEEFPSVGSGFSADAQTQMRDSSAESSVDAIPEKIRPALGAQTSDDLAYIPVSQTQFEEVAPEPQGPVTSDMSEIAEFGNKPIEATGAGALHYDVEISGIDSPELRKDLEDVLRDRKLGLLPQQYIPKIADGILLIRQVHPVKAAVLVNKLKHTALGVKWSSIQMIKASKTIIFLFAVLFATSFFNKALANGWEAHEASLKQTVIKINNLQDDIHEMILKGKKETDPLKKDDALLEIKKKYADLKQAHRDLLQEMEHVRFEHPERGDKTDRQYKHIHIKTLEELENDSSIDGQLGRIKRKAVNQYGGKVEASPSPTAKPSPAKK